MWRSALPVAHSHGTKSAKPGQLGTSLESAGENGVLLGDERNAKEKEKEKKKQKKKGGPSIEAAPGSSDGKGKESEDEVDLKKEKKKEKRRKKKEGKLTDASGDEVERDGKPDERRDKKKEKKAKDKPSIESQGNEKIKSVSLISILHKSASSKRDSKGLELDPDWLKEESKYSDLQSDHSSSSNKPIADDAPAAPSTPPRPQILVTTATDRSIGANRDNVQSSPTNHLEAGDAVRNRAKATESSSNKGSISPSGDHGNQRRQSMVEVVRNTMLGSLAEDDTGAGLKGSASTDSLVVFGEHAAFQTEPIYFRTAASQLEELPWTTRLWRSISESYHGQGTFSTTNTPAKPEKRASVPSLMATHSEPAGHLVPDDKEEDKTVGQETMAKGGARPLGINLGWIIQRIDSPEPRRASPPLQRMRREDMLMLQQVQQSITLDQVDTARAKLKLYLACAEHLYRVPIEDLKPLFRMADNPHVNAQRLQLLLADVIRANPWLHKSGEMYFAWWSAGATTSFRDNFDALVEDMKQHPLPADEVSRVLFVRPASALGHMRHHPDSQSIASVVGLSINVVELPPQLQDDDVMDALAQLSMSRGPGSIRSRSMHSFGSSDVIVPSDTFLDNVSLQTYGTANTMVMTTGSARDGASINSIVDLGEVFVLLDRNGDYVATIRVTEVAETVAGAPLRVVQQLPASGPIVVGYGLSLTQEGSYIRRDVHDVSLTCDVDFMAGDHVPAVLQKAHFKGATVVGNAVVVQRQDVVLERSDTVVRTHCVAMTDLRVNVDETTKLGNYVCVSVHNLPVIKDADADMDFKPSADSPTPIQ